MGTTGRAGRRARRAGWRVRVERHGSRAVSRPGEPGQIVYFAPDTLEWETFDGGYSHWLMWMLGGGLAEYYSTVFWPSWQTEVASLGLREGITMYPPLWSAEGASDIAGTSRKSVPMPELVAFHVDTARQLG